MKSQVENFVENWGQSHKELCSNLNYDTETSDDIIMLDYFWDVLDEVWLPKQSTLYSKKEQKIANELMN
jgi:hypothetical protein